MKIKYITHFAIGNDYGQKQEIIYWGNRERRRGRTNIRLARYYHTGSKGK